MKYRVNWNYHSSLCDAWQLGRLEAGGTVDLEPTQAEAINGDSPGVLSEDAPAPKRKAKAASNRKAKGATNRAVKSEDA